MPEPATPIPRSTARTYGPWLVCLALVVLGGVITVFRRRRPGPHKGETYAIASLYRRGRDAVGGLAKVLAAHSRTGNDEEWKWEVVLDHVEGRAKARDRNVANIVEVVAGQTDPSRMRCLILDLVRVGPNETIYEHTVLYSASGGVLLGEDKLVTMGCERVDWRRWRIVERAVDDLLAEPLSPVPFRTGGVDAILVSYFDGSEWRVQAWYDFIWGQLYKDHPGDLRALFRLLYCVNHRLGKEREFGFWEPLMWKILEAGDEHRRGSQGGQTGENPGDASKPASQARPRE